jgi:hypothetical protein
VGDDIVERLRSQHSDLRQGAYYSQREDSAWDATADAADEIERLRAAVDVVLAEVGNHHRPNSDGRGCWWCGPGDGSWPCVHRMVLDELKAARHV